MSRGFISPNLSDIPCYPATEIARDGALLDGKIVHAVAGKAWDDIALGFAYGTKSVLSITPGETDGHPLIKEAGLLEERLGWKLSCLSSVNSRYGAVKIVGANALNRQLGLPRSRSTIVLMDKSTLVPLCLLDGTDISAAPRRLSWRLIDAMGKRFARSLCVAGQVTLPHGSRDRSERR